MIPSLIERIRSLSHRLGMDQAVGYTVGARASNIIGSTVTVLLIVRYLSKVEQGYYYTLLSLVSLQIVFELGFSFVVLQLAAHEAVHLTFRRDGTIEGNPTARTRLVAIFQKTARWYLFAGTVMGALLMPAGMLFFHRNSNPGDSSMWLGPWAAAALSCVVLFVLNPFCSFLEGCGQVREVARMRMAQAVLGMIASWTTMVLHAGLYSPAAVIWVYILVVLVFLNRRRGLLFGLLRAETPPDVLTWRAEVWAFQWKIAITWLCSYFTVQVLTPVLFASHGPEEAGRMGMSLSIAGYLWSLIFAWMSTKAAPFGQFIAKGDYAALDRVFFGTLWQSLAILGAVATACFAMVVGIQKVAPSIASRMVSPGSFALLLLAAVGTFIVQCEAIYLRAHKEEPLVWQSLIVALLTCLGAWLAAPRWGSAGASFVYFLCSGVIGVASATMIFQFKRASRRLQVSAPAEMPLEVLR